MLGIYGVSLVKFVTCVVQRVLWYLCGVGECDFGHLIVMFCMVHKCGFLLMESVVSLRG